MAEAQREEVGVRFETDDLVALLQRQFQYLSGLSGVAFLRQLGRWFRALTRDPRIQAYLQDLRQEATSLADEWWAADDSNTERLVAVKRALCEKAQSIDDSDETYDPLDVNVMHSFFKFDQLVKAQGRKPLAETLFDLANGARTANLLQILRTRIGMLQSKEDLQAIDVELHALGEVEDQHQHQHRTFTTEKLAHPGVSLLRIETALQDMNPDPSGGLMAYARARKRKAVFDALYEGPVDANGREAVSAWASELKSHVERVHEELLLRIGVRRSLLALVDRYRSRCEWHDRERLREIAKKAGRRGEDALTAEFARWLFDQGFDPLTKPLVAGLQPDLLEPYVEAKRYIERKGTRQHIQRGMWQLHDTVAALRGTPREVREAIFIVFRLGGPRCVLPPVVQGEGWTVLLHLVDIGPAELSGSRQREQPIEISIDELAPRKRENSARPRTSTAPVAKRRRRGRRP